MQILLNCLGQREVEQGGPWAMLYLCWDGAHVTGSTADMFGHAAVNCSLFSPSLPQAGGSKASGHRAAAE